MLKAEHLVGQWIGYFEYGPEYGEVVNGEKVSFRLFIDNSEDGQFTGRAIDLEGIGANHDIAQVRGFITDELISFTKEYRYTHGLDDNGEMVEYSELRPTVIMYLGQYSRKEKKFMGEWELRVDIQQSGDGWLEDICTGKWEMSKDEQ